MRMPDILIGIFIGFFLWGVFYAGFLAGIKPEEYQQLAKTVCQYKDNADFAEIKEYISEAMEDGKISQYEYMRITSMLKDFIAKQSKKDLERTCRGQTRKWKNSLSKELNCP